MNQTKSNWKWLLLILILGTALRLYHLDHASIWLDEKISLAESNGCIYRSPQFEGYFTTEAVKERNNFKNIVKATIRDDGGNGLLYIMLLHYWQRLFGPLDFSIRMLSVIFSCLLIITVYVFSLKVFQSARIALIASALIALHPMLIIYAQEARPYILPAFLSFISSLFFYLSFMMYSATPVNKLNVAAYSFFSLCALFSHYFTVYIFLAQGACFLIYVRNKKLWLLFILSWLPVIIIIAAWMTKGGLEGMHYMNIHNAQYTVRLNTLKEGENPFLLRANFKNIFLGWLQVIDAVAGNTLQSDFRLRQISFFLIIPAVLLFFAFRKNLLHKKVMVFLAIAFIASPVYATVLSLIGGHTLSFQARYGIFAVPYLMILIAVGFEKIISGDYNKWFKIFIPSGFIIIMIVSLYFRYRSNIYTYSNEISNPLLKAARLIEKQTSPEDTVVYYSQRDAIITNIYLNKNINRIQITDTTVEDKMILKNTNTVLFDFENGKYRY